MVAVIGLLFIGLVGLWEHTMTTLAIIVTAVFVSILIGIPLGITAAKNDRFEQTIRPILDGMQTMPSFVYLIPAVFFFGLGKVPAVVATFIYAVPPSIRLTNLGIRQVAAETVEAGKAFGCTGAQLLLKIQLPLARPSIMAGINQTIMMALAMVVIASMIGASGLGLEVLRGIERLDVGRGFLAGFAIVIVAIIIDRISQAFGRAGITRK
jgi:glycine betaine/proline transport system permease protein